MPFLVGRAPVRRTMNYLNKGILAIKEPIKIMTLNYNKRGDHNEGAKDFEFWFFPQIQFKNPHVQIISLTNLTPTPFIQCFFGKNFILFCSLKVFGGKVECRRMFCFSIRKRQGSCFGHRWQNQTGNSRPFG